VVRSGQTNIPAAVSIVTIHEEEQHWVWGITAATADALEESSHAKTVSLLLEKCDQGSLELTLVRPAQLLASLFLLEPSQPLQSFRGSVPQGFDDPTAGWKNWCDRRHCLRRCFRLNQLNRCNRPRVCPSRLRRPYGWVEELVRPPPLLESLFSLAPAQPLQSSRGTVPRAFGDRTAGRKNWCDRRNCLRRCLRLNQLNRCNRPEGLSLEAPATMRWGGRIGATGVTACVVVFA
jgi:hypothetical protein